MRSSARAVQITSSTRVMERGSSIMKVMSWRITDSYSRSMPMSSRATRTAASASHRAEVAGSRLAARQHVGAFFVDGDFERIDLVVIGNHHFAEAAVAADHGAERIIELLFDDAAHRQHFVADVLQLVVELLGDVMTDVDSVHYLTSSLHRLRGCHFGQRWSGLVFSRNGR